MKLNATQVALVEDNLDLVDRATRHLPLRYRKNLPLVDVQGEGMLGLCQAATRWDPEGDASFRTFARNRIVGAIRDAARAADPMSRETRRLVTTGQMGAIRQNERRSAEYLRTVDPLRLDHTHPDYDRPLAELLHDEAAPIDDTVCTRVVVGDALAVLSPRHREVVTLTCWEGRSQTAIAPRFGVTSSRVSQMVTEALTQMREVIGPIDGMPSTFPASSEEHAQSDS